MPDAVVSKAVCILHANCLGDMLRPLLENVPAFSRLFTIHQFTNYTGDEIPDTIIDQCRLYLYQYLAPKWGKLSTDQMLARLPGSCTSIEIPNFLFKGYWPFWQSGSEIIDFCNKILEDLLRRDLHPEEVLHLYLKGDPNLLGDIAHDVENLLLELKKNDIGKPIPYTHIISEYWKKEQLFLTVNHPGKRLIFHVVSSLLQLLGLGPLALDVRQNFVHPFDDFWQPIHPAVGSALQLPFVSTARRYRIFKNMFTHREYSCCYLACRAHHEKDLLVMLRNLPEGYRP